MADEAENNRCGMDFIPYARGGYPLVADGVLKGVWPRGAEFFRVEEIPLYPFSGEGEHAALVVEKSGSTTRDLAAEAARLLSIQPMAIGYGGMKDKDAVTVQAFTIAGVDEKVAAAAFQEAGGVVVTVTRHKNKLRLGHLAGNRFRIFLKGGDPELCAGILVRLKEVGVPNYFGPQRFGADGSNARDGLRVLRGQKKFGRWKRDLAVSALQSLLFNEVLARRIEEGEFARVVLGDLLQKTDSGGIFLCEDDKVDQERFSSRQIVPTGPMYGKKMKDPTGRPGETEAAVLADFGLTRELFASETGTRRPLVVWPEGAGVEAATGGLWLTFALESGSYATSVVREIAESGVWRE